MVVNCFSVHSPTLKKSKEGSVLGGKQVQQQIKYRHEGGREDGRMTDQDRRKRAEVNEGMMEAYKRKREKSALLGKQHS